MCIYHKFSNSLGIPNSRIGQIIASAPSLFSYSIENSLKPTVRYLVERSNPGSADLIFPGILSPQILVQRIDISWNTGYIFLSKELGAPRDNVVKMFTRHPQLLHYSIDDGLLPRINFLWSIGMRNADILKVLTSLTQVFSLSLEDNLKPKYMYSINELPPVLHVLRLRSWIRYIVTEDFRASIKFSEYYNFVELLQFCVLL